MIEYVWLNVEFENTNFLGTFLDWALDDRVACKGQINQSRAEPIIGRSISWHLQCFCSYWLDIQLLGDFAKYTFIEWLIKRSTFSFFTFRTHLNFLIFFIHGQETSRKLQEYISNSKRVQKLQETRPIVTIPVNLIKTQRDARRKTPLKPQEKGKNKNWSSLAEQSARWEYHFLETWPFLSGALD